MRYKSHKIILLLVIGLFVVESSVSAKNFSIFNATSSAPYFFVNGTSGSVGVGITNPGSRFVIKADAAQEPLWLFADAGYSILRFADRTGSTRAWVGNDSGGRFSFKNFISGGDLYLTTTGTGKVIVDNGNVGIGTTNPTQKLQISSGYVLADNGYGYAFGDTGTFISGNSVSGFLSFYPDGSEAMRINTSGNVGIGTTTINTKLTIDNGGAGNAIDVLSSKIANLATPTASTDAANKSYVDTAVLAATSSMAYWTLNGSNLFASSTAWNVGIGTTNPLYKLAVDGDIQLGLNDDKSLVWGPGGGRITGNNDYELIMQSYNGLDFIIDTNGNVPDLAQFRILTGTTNPTTATELLRVEANGKVGIGSTAPISLLTLYGSNPRLSITNNVLNSGNTGIDFILNPGMTAERKNAIVVEAAGSYGRGDMSFILDSATDSNNYEIATDTKMIIKNSGNVGIGTTAPGVKLDVVGNIKLSNTTGDSQIEFAPSGDSYLKYANSMRWYSSSGTPGERMLLTAGGNLGIGTTTVNTKLTVNNGGAGSAIDVLSSKIANLATPTASTDAANKSYVDTAVLAATSSMAYWTLNGSNLYASSTAWNLGIGTTSPTYKLDVMSSSGGMAARISSAQAWTDLYLNNSGGYGIIETAGNKINFWSGATSTMTLSGTSVGIGTNNPGARLDVITADSTMGLRLRNDSTGNIFPLRFQNMIGSSGNSLVQYVTSGNADSNVGSAVLGWATSYMLEYTGTYGSLTAPSQFKGWQWMVYDGSAYSPRFNVTAGGNVGIGTSNPSYKLQVSHATDTALYVERTSANASAGILKAGDGLVTIGANTFDPLQLVVNATPVMYFSTGANAGIGTTTVNTKLTVDNGGAGNAIDVLSSKIANLATPTTSTDAANKAYVDSALATATSSIASYWNLSGSSLYASTTTWNVGIGTTNASSTLHVYGNAKIGKAISAGIKTLDVAGNLNFDTVANPTNTEVQGMSLADGGAGSIEAGTYYYAVMYATAEGDTGSTGLTYSGFPGITLAGSGRVNISNIPISSDPRVTSRKIYRSQAGTAGDYYYLYYIGTISDNTTTTYTDNSARNTTATDWIYNKNNTTAGIIYRDGTVFGRLGDYVTAFGNGAMANVSRGSTGAAFGSSALGSVTTGDSNQAFGHSALSSVTTGGNNIGIGYAAMQGNQTGGSNVAVGNNAHRNNFNYSSSGNTAVGTNALITNFTNNNYNSAFGANAGEGAQGTGGVYLGAYAASHSTATTVGSYNVAIGYLAGSNLGSGGSNVLIGSSVNAPLPTGSNQLNIGNIIYGVNMGTGFVPSATGKVGIGTTTINTKLTVDNGGTGNAIDVLSSKIVNLATPTADTDAANKSYVDSAVSSATSSLSSYWTLSGSNLFASSTAWNLGIGTTLPQEKLHIAGDPTNTSQPSSITNSVNDLHTGLFINGNGGAINEKYGIQFGNYNQYGFAGIYSVMTTTTGATLGDLTFDLKSSTGAATLSERVRLTSAGYFGIGTTSPAEMLSVAGNILSTGSISGASLSVSGNEGVAGGTPILNIIDTTNYATGVGGSLRFWGEYNTAGSSLAAGQIDSYKENSTDGNYNFAMRFMTRPQAGNLTERLRIAADGNVGIGTTTIDTKLTVDNGGTGNALDVLSSKIVNLATPTASTDAANKSYVDSVVSSATSSLSSYWTLSGSNLFASSTSWNVGIGTSTPDNKLQVMGGIKSGGIGVNGSIMIARSSDGASSGSLTHSAGSILTINQSGGLASNIIMGGSGIEFQTEDSTSPYAKKTRMIIRHGDSGNVGIGITNPGKLFTVFNDSGVVGTDNELGRFSTTNDNAFIGIGRTASYRLQVGFNTYLNYAHLQSYTTNMTTYGPLVLNQLGGNVGIGTTTVDTKLTINNGGAGNAIDVLSSKIANLATPATSTDAANKAYVDSAVAALGGINYWELNGSNLYATNTAWNIGIGTTDPGAFKLKVAGNVAITGNLETQTGADFAEEFRTNKQLEPGTVVVMGNLGYRSATPCVREHDKKVLGVVSDNPALIAGKINLKNKNEYKAVVAITGVVTVKVSAVNGAVERGDLLTSSAISGYAMKADEKQAGTIIGKALEDLSGRQGKIKVLVNLQ